MLEVVIPAFEVYDEATDRFEIVKQATLRMEHSLVSVSKWESRWRKPFLVRGGKSRAETVDYFRCMTITQNVDPRVFRCMPYAVEKAIAEYINTPQTATTISQDPNEPPSSRIVTSEVLYYRLAAFGIPFDPVQKWHLTRMLALLGVAAAENKTRKPMSKSELASRNRMINEARRAKLKSRG